MKDDVQIGGDQAPQLRPKTEACRSCGAQTEMIGGRCLSCLKAAWWEATVNEQKHLLRAGYKPNIVFDAGDPHLALIETPEIAWCGLALPLPIEPATIEARSWRPPEPAPLGLCAACREKLETTLEGLQR